MSRLQLVKDTIVYGGAAVLRYSIGFILLPIYTRILRPEEYASLDLVIAAAAFLNLLLDLQLGPSANRFYRDYPGDEQKRFLGGVLLLRLWTGLLPALALAAAALFWQIGYIPPAANGRVLWTVAVLNVPFALLAELQFLYLRMLERRWTYVALSFGSSLVGGVASLLLMWRLRWGPLGFLVGQALANILAFLLLCVLLRTNLRWTWVTPGLRNLLRFGLPLIPGLILTWCWAYLSRFYMVRMLPLDQIAVFALANKVLLFMGFLGVAFRAAWDPISMKVLYESGEGSAAWYASSFNLYTAALLVVTALLSAGARPLIAVLGPASYADAAQLVPFLAISSALSFAATSLNIGNQVARKTWNWSLAMLAGVAVMTVVLVLYTRTLGLMAAALGVLAGSMVQLVIVFVSSQANFQVPYAASSLRAGVLGLAGMITAHTLGIMALVPRGAAECAILLIGVTAAVNICTVEERKALWTFGWARLGGRRNGL
jgi:O-antigen/teichoic acid export membrane protein